jgi:hypothetical protein
MPCRGGSLPERICINYVVLVERGQCSSTCPLGTGGELLRTLCRSGHQDWTEEALDEHSLLVRRGCHCRFLAGCSDLPAGSRLIEHRANPNKIRDWDNYPFVFRCELPTCYYVVSAKTEDDAYFVSCQHYQDRNKHMAQEHSVSLFKLMFNELDLAIDQFMVEQDELRKAELKGQIRGTAACVVLWMKPIFLDVDAVRREGMKRYKGRQSGVEHKTAGVDYKWQPGESLPGKPVVDPTTITGKKTPEQAGQQLVAETTANAETIVRIQRMNKAGFDVKTIAAQTKLPSSTVQSVLSTLGA